MVRKAEATFQVTKWDESAFLRLPGGGKLTRAKVLQDYAGDVVGEARTEYTMVHRPDGTATFVAVQHVKGSIEGREGTFVLQGKGSFDGGTARGTWEVAEGMGTGALVDLRGRGDFMAAKGPSGTASFVFE